MKRLLFFWFFLLSVHGTLLSGSPGLDSAAPAHEKSLTHVEFAGSERYKTIRIAPIPAQKKQEYDWHLSTFELEENDDLISFEKQLKNFPVSTSLFSSTDFSAFTYKGNISVTFLSGLFHPLSSRYLVIRSLRI